MYRVRCNNLNGIRRSGRHWPHAWTEVTDGEVTQEMRDDPILTIEYLTGDASTITPALGSEPQPDFDDTIDPFGGDVTAMREAVEEAFSTEEIAQPGDSVSKAVSKPAPRRRASRPRKARS